MALQKLPGYGAWGRSVTGHNLKYRFKQLHIFFSPTVAALERRSDWKPKFKCPLNVEWGQNLFLHRWYLKFCQCCGDPMIVEKVRRAAVALCTNSEVFHLKRVGSH